MEIANDGNVIDDERSAKSYKYDASGNLIEIQIAQRGNHYVKQFTYSAGGNLLTESLWLRVTP